jgi:hypothetical protein
MKKWVDCGTVSMADNFLGQIVALGLDIKWSSGDPLTGDVAHDQTIGYDSKDGGIMTSWTAKHGKQTTPERFLLELEIKFLKKWKKALPKLGK